MAEDAPLWELRKENAAPLERGRNVSVLEQSLLAEDREEHAKMLEHYERLVRPSEDAAFQADADDDPLIHWLSYIKYHQETFVNDTHEQFLLLERCFRALSKLQRYQDDFRFVGVCGMYAERTTRAAEIFQYLYQRKIGRKIAIFWAAWAWNAENNKDYALAEKIFTRGIAEQAQPLNMLPQRHKQFQRRMSRLFLNSINAESDEDDADQGRGALGGLSTEAVRRNDRSRSFAAPPVARTSTFVDRQRLTAPNPASNVPTSSGFRIFVEENSGSAHCPLDNSFPAVNEDRELEREEDRIKENTLSAERWNERGGLSLGPALAEPSRPAVQAYPSFEVFVDDECAAAHERTARQQDLYEDHQRLARDDRTFRELKDGGAAEKLTRDPLRYVRDPYMLQADQDVSQGRQEPTFRQQANPVRKPKATAAANLAVDEALLLAADGYEQSQEEARAKARFYRLDTNSPNVNLFHALTRSTHDSMEVDDESTTNVSMESVERPPPFPLSTRQDSFARQSSRFDSSQDGLTPRNTSTTSSTIDEVLAASAPVRKDEQTINTQWALKELSMMFSSPAVPSGDHAQDANRSGGLGPILNESGVSEAADGDGDTASLTSIAEYLDDATGRSGDWKKAPPSARPSQAGHGFSIYTEASEPQAAARLGTSSFAIYSDEPKALPNKSHQAKPPTSLEICNDGDETKEPRNAPAKLGFTIFEDHSTSENNELKADCDTATFSMFGDAFQELNIVADADNETASVSISLDGPDNVPMKSFGDDATTIDLPAFGDVSCIAPVDDPTVTMSAAIQSALASAIDYKRLHELDIKHAIQKIKSTAQAHLPTTSALVDILSTKRLLCDCATDVIPRAFKQSPVPGGATVKIGRSTASVVCELGRGAYGVVAVLKDSRSSSTVAVKAQKPTGSLAWECEIMRKIEERVGDRLETSCLSGFSLAHAFVSLADGALLSMTHRSTSGLNLVDLVNVYRTRIGKDIPELVALHYTARMLKHLEVLHWHGKILHCDAKPDNWVLVPSDSVDGGRVDASDVMLIDFGRSVDLETAKRKGKSSMETMLTGEATTKEMLCVAMRKGLPWSFDVDTFGVCASAHVLLFGRYVELERSGSRWLPKDLLATSRNLLGGLWTDVFGTLLNLDDVSQTALGSHPKSVRQLRCRIEAHLEEHEGALERALRQQATFLPNHRSELY